MRKSWLKKTLAAALCAFAWLCGAGGRPAAAQVCDPDTTPPYLFILMDTSASMNWLPPCNSTELGAGDCTLLCLEPTGCRAPLQADDPASKFYLLKSALYASLSAAEADDIQFGFATFNQDALSVRSKHWLYEATEDGVTIPGAGAFPATGEREVFGKTWACDTGSGDHDIGCYASSPADLPDAWERERMRQLPKAGQAVNETVTFYIRKSPTSYRVQYIPVSGTLGSSVDIKVRIEKCLNAACSSRQLTGETTVTFSPVAEHLTFTVNADRNEPVGFFSQSPGADASAGNTCAGWDPNTDSTADAANSYSLRWPTVSDSYSRGSDFDSGDVLPFDWLDDHRQGVLERLAPNQIANPLDPPDFRIAPYLNDAPLTGQSYLRLKDEDARILIPIGSTPIGGTLQSFRTWWSSWQSTAAGQDPDWACRRHAVVLITDGEESCEASPCDVADDLYTIDGVSVYVVGFGVESSPGSSLACIAANGGTTSPFYTNTYDELVQALKDVFTAVK
jgi:hypothetical protein